MKTTPKGIEEEVIEIEGDNADEGVAGPSTHGVINLIEAMYHIQCMDEALQDMKAKIKTGEVKDILKTVLQELRDTIMIVMPQMAKVNILVILRSIKDPACLSLWPQTEESEGLLEMMLTEDIPRGHTIAKLVSDMKEMTYNQKDMLVE